MLEHHVKLAIAGNKDSFSWIIKDVDLSLYRVAKGILFNDEDCADAIQETIIKAYQSIHRLNNPIYFKTWIIRILINECRSLLKSKKKVVPVSEEFSQYRQVEIEQDIEIWDALKRLNEQMRMTVILYYLEGWSLKETANILNIAEGTVKSRLARARAELASILTEPSERRGVQYE